MPSDAQNEAAPLTVRLPPTLVLAVLLSVVKLPVLGVVLPMGVPLMVPPLMFGSLSTGLAEDSQRVALTATNSMECPADRLMGTAAASPSSCTPPGG